MFTNEYLEFAFEAVREHIIGDATHGEVEDLLRALESFCGKRLAQTVTTHGSDGVVMEFTLNVPMNTKPV